MNWFVQALWVCVVASLMATPLWIIGLAGVVFNRRDLIWWNPQPTAVDATSGPSPWVSGPHGKVVR